MGPIDVTVVGNALESEGFVGANYAMAGLGLNTFGFLWPCDAIWVDTESAITTTWTAATLPIVSTEVCIDGN